MHELHVVEKMDRTEQVRTFITKFHERMFQWELLREENANLQRDGKLSIDDERKIAKRELAKIVSDYRMIDPNNASSDSFSLYPRYDIENIESIEQVSDQKFLVRTSRRFSKQSEEEYLYEVFIRENESLSLGNRMTLNFDDSDWEITRY